MTRVAIQGIDGSYSSEAARALVGTGLSLVECGDFESTFDAIRSGKAECAVIPVENRIVGQIRRPVDLLTQSGAKVSGSHELKIDHVLVGMSGSCVEELISVTSHVEALRQCQRFLDRYPTIERDFGSDTASSVLKVVTDGDGRRGAIGSRRAAEMYGATVIREGIADEADNWTKFYLIRS